jgi:hypothetical protein
MDGLSVRSSTSGDLTIRRDYVLFVANVPENRNCFVTIGIAGAALPFSLVLKPGPLSVAFASERRTHARKP